MHTRSIYKDLNYLINYYKNIGQNTYNFQPVTKKNINLFIQIHYNLNIVTFKANNIFVLFNEEFGYSGRYILHHFKYEDINDAVRKISYIFNNYVIYNGLLICPIEMNKIKKESTIFKENLNNCSICYEITNETTICNHHICIQCRENMINHRKYDCPICRKKETLFYFNNENNEIYNLQHNELDSINNDEIMTFNTNNNFNNVYETVNYLRYNVQHSNNLNPVTSLILIREIITFNSAFPYLVVYSLFKQIYNNKFSISLFALSSYWFTNYFINYLKDNTYDCCHDEF